MKGMKIAIIIPAYNEEKSLAGVLKAIPAELPGVTLLETVVINDGSTDKTAAVARKHDTTLLTHPINRGQGAALQTGFSYALENDFDVAITFDADGQHSADEIKDILQPIISGNYDVALGSRFSKKAPQNLSRARFFVLKAGVLFTRIVSRVKVSDTHNGFRAFHRRALSSIHLIHDKMEHASELLDEIGRHKLRYCEVPVTVQYTDYSTSKKTGNKNSDAIKIAFKILASKILK